MATYQPWRFAPRTEVRKMRQEAFRNNSTIVAENPKPEKTNPLDAYRGSGGSTPPLAKPAPKPKKKSKSLGSRIKDIGEDIGGGLSDIADVGLRAAAPALAALDIPARYTLRPAVGALGYLGAEERTDEKTGIKYTESPSWTDIGQGFKELVTQNPLDSYREGKRAMEGRLADPNLSAGGRMLLSGVTDPLTYIGPGMVGRSLKILPEALQATRAARTAAAAKTAATGAKVAPQMRGSLRAATTILEAPRAVSVGGLAGSAVGAEAAERGGLGEKGQLFAALGGGLLGGTAASLGSRLRPPGGRDTWDDAAHVGKKTRVLSGEQGDYEFQYRLADLDDLTISHDPYDFAENPNYPAEFQPRKRDQDAAQLQVADMQINVSPERRLAETYDLQNGIPIIGPDGIVESGNGRTMGLIRAAKDNPKGYAAYVKMLSEKLKDYGLDKAQMDRFERPILVRERITDVDRAAFAREANGSSTLRMSVAEQAASDAKRISDHWIQSIPTMSENTSLDDVLRSPDSKGFISAFLYGLGANETGGLVDAGGALSSAGLARAKAALFARAFPGEAGGRLLGQFFESADPGAKLIKTAIEQALPRISKLEAAIRGNTLDPSLAMGEHLAAAADKYAFLKGQGTSVKKYLDQMALMPELSPEATAILEVIGENPRSTRRLREVINAYIEEAMDPNRPLPGQTGMFGDEPTPEGFLPLWRKAAGQVEDPEDLSALPMFAPGEEPPTPAAAPEAAVEPEAPAAPEVPAAVNPTISKVSMVEEIEQGGQKLWIGYRADGSYATMETKAAAIRISKQAGVGPAKTAGTETPAAAPAGRGMKVRDHKTVNGQSIVYWHDPAYGWVVRRQDAAGNQIGEADYVGPRSALQKGLEFAEHQANQATPEEVPTAGTATPEIAPEVSRPSDAPFKPDDIVRAPGYGGRNKKIVDVTEPAPGYFHVSYVDEGVMPMKSTGKYRESGQVGYQYAVVQEDGTVLDPDGKPWTTADGTPIKATGKPYEYPEGAKPEAAAPEAPSKTAEAPSAAPEAAPEPAKPIGKHPQSEKPDLWLDAERDKGQAVGRGHKVGDMVWVTDGRRMPDGWPPEGMVAGKADTDGAYVIFDDGSWELTSPHLLEKPKPRPTGTPGIKPAVEGPRDITGYEAEPPQKGDMVHVPPKLGKDGKVIFEGHDVRIEYGPGDQVAVDWNSDKLQGPHTIEAIRWDPVIDKWQYTMKGGMPVMVGHESQFHPPESAGKSMDDLRKEKIAAKRQSKISPGTAGEPRSSKPSNVVSKPPSRTSPTETSTPQTSPGGVSEPAVSSAPIKASNEPSPKASSAAPTILAASPEASTATPATLPGGRPEGEPKQVPIPGGGARAVDDLRAEAPAGYRLRVPDEGEPEYRRILSNADIEWRKAHPESPPLKKGDVRNSLKGIGDFDEIADAYGMWATRYHSRFNTPTPTLRKDWKLVQSEARSALFNKAKAELMEELGIEPSDLKAMEAAERTEMYRSIRARVKRTMKGVDDEVLRDEWFEPLKPLFGEGFQIGRPSGGIGSGADQPPLIPPEGPPKEKPGRPGKGGTEKFGEEPPIDMFGMGKRKENIAAEVAKQEQPLTKMGNALKALFGRLDDKDVRTKIDPFTRGWQELQSRIEHIAEGMATQEDIILRRSGIEAREDANRVWYMYADGKEIGLYDDVIEGTTDAGKAGRSELSDMQNDALDIIRRNNTRLNGNKKFYGAKVAIDPDIEGDYLGRRVLERRVETEGGTKVIERAGPEGQPRKVGAQRSKSRTMESVEALIEKGFRTEDPRVARQAIITGKLMDAADAYAAKNLKPLRVRKPGSTFGLAQVSEHPAFNGSWFDPVVQKRISKGLEAPERGTLVRAASAVNSILTPIRASFDLSAALQQGQRIWLTDPKSGGELQWAVLKSLKDDKSYEDALLKLMNEGPGLDYLTENNLRFTGEIGREEFGIPAGAQNWMQQKAGPAGVVTKPLAKGLELSNKHFGRTLNLYRMKMANSAYKRFTDLGLEGAELDAAMKSSNKGINRAFGWTPNRPTTIESAALFAPRYFRASVETIWKAVEGTVKLGHASPEAAAARDHMALLLGEGATLVWLINTARGKETEFDPRDPNFLRIRDVGGVDITPFGTYNTLFRAIAGAVGGGDYEDQPVAGRIGQLWRVAEGKMSPAAKLVYEPFIKRETYLGKPLSPLTDPKTAAIEQLKSSVPFGLQNYVEEGPVAAGVGSLGIGNTPLTPAEHRDAAREEHAQRMFKKPYEDLTGAQKAQVNEQKEVAGHQETVDERSLESSGDSGRATQIRMQVESEMNAAMADLERGTDESGNEFTGNDFRKAYNDTMLRAAGARSLLKYKGGDESVNEWFDLYDEAKMGNGQIDYDKLEQLQAAYRSDHPGIDERVDKIVGIRDNKAVRELRQAKKLANEYYSLPAYRGMSKEESEHAQSIINQANDMVSFGTARNRADALRQLGARDAEGTRLARRATNAGPNRAREEFRKQNALFALYYSDVPATLIK